MARTEAPARTTRRVAPPLEHRILLTATLCLLAYGAVMVYSASSPQGVIEDGGYGTSEFFMYLFAAGLGLVLMRVFEFYGLRLLSHRMVGLLLGGSFLLVLVVLVPGIGLEVSGARRWFGAGPIQFQPSELMKFALILYTARYLADNPRRIQRTFKEAVAPVAIVLAPACLLIAIEPDLGTTLVAFFAVVAMLVVSGMPMRYVGTVVAVAGVGAVMFILAEPYQRARLLAFLHPFAAEATGGYQSAQGQIAIGSGGMFGVGLGNSIQKLFWLPEAQTDFILAVIGEELGVAGILALVVLYGMIAYAGLRTARRAATRYTKLLASGLTALILCQAILNIFVVLGIAPLTGVPLPFISYAPTNLLVMLGSVGLLLGIARPAARELRLVDRRGERRTTAVARDTYGEGYGPGEDRDSRRRDGGTRGARAGRGGRAAG
ncbi:MAG TPA: putative lipid II flippase FtsW [Solirubrobacteraceae bacterium]|nr:putative lipid II flippase FtsW [Solirubrobacteraceae bacterium]